MPLGLKNALNDSDSEDDDDYVPPAERDSDSAPSGNEDNKQNLTSVERGAIVDEDSKKQAREALWSSFQASVNNAAPSSSKEIQAPKLIIVEKRYRFAGEDVVEVVEVPEDSAQAKQWPLWNATGTETEESINSSSLATASPEPTTTTTQPNLAGPISSSSASAQSFASSTSAPIPPPSKPPTRKPGPRKPRTSLASIPGASKAKKLSTLDKSAMDWRAHVQAEQESGSSVKDELEANRRGGGYLEKVEFLKRVEERKEENLDALKSKKRRKL